MRIALTSPARRFGQQQQQQRCQRWQPLSTLLRLSPPVREALRNGEPVVALESTIISHGMPFPQNVETARQVEAAVSAQGSTPATVALLDGKICVGLTDEELQRLGSGQQPVVKASRRDMAAVLSQRLLGATTVSGTMIAAHLARIQVFATGGIGGVHRGAETTMDVSADLTELGRTPVAVVCAGAKSILDLPKTLEYLETQGVPVIAYGETNELPAFFSPHSGLKAPWRAATPEQVAGIIKAGADLGLQNGTVVAVPIPREHAHDSAQIEQAIEAAVLESEERGIKGKDATPFLLKRYPGGSARTAVYNALHGPDGDLVAAVADMDINGMLSAQQIEEAFERLDPGVVGLDANASTLAISNTLTLASRHRSCIVAEPTSVPKCVNVLSALSFIKRSEAMSSVNGLVHIITPNELELRKMAEIALELTLVESTPTTDTVAEMAEHYYTLQPSVIGDILTLSPLFPVIVVKLGEKGVVVASPSPAARATPVIRHISPLKPSLLINSNGAGDSLVGAILAQLHQRQALLTPSSQIALSPLEIDTIVRRAQRASILSLESPRAVSESLSPSLISDE
ncbi:hypothetical protein GGF46_001143 [Coemansia sp. RSA 552]|nr:hypothetical protein GGF46_001143 [Coemansia sp. RSA 552]